MNLICTFATFDRLSASSVAVNMATTIFSLFRRADQHSCAARISWSLLTSVRGKKRWPSSKTWNKLYRSRR